MRIVALDALHRRQVGAEVKCSEIVIRIVAHEAEPRHRTGKLKGLIAAVGIVTGCTLLLSGSMGAISLHQRLHGTVTVEAQFGPRRPEERLLRGHMRLMTLDTAPVPDRSVNRPLVELLFEVGVTGKTEPVALDEEAELGSAGSSMTALT